MLRGTLPESEDMSGQPSLNTIESAREAVSSSKYTEALNLLDELEDSGFVDAELYLLRGISFAQVGKAEAATESLKKAAKANPSVVTFYNLAVHLSNIGESADALAVAQKCQKLAPESTGVKSLVAAIESSSDHVAFQLAELQSSPRNCRASADMGSVESICFVCLLRIRIPGLRLAGRWWGSRSLLRSS